MELYRENSVLRLLNNNNINRKFEEQDRLTVPHFFFKHQVTRFPLKLTFRALSLFSDKGLTLDMSAFKPFTVANLRYHSVNNTKLPCYTFLPTQHHSFLRKFIHLHIHRLRMKSTIDFKHNTISLKILKNTSVNRALIKNKGVVIEGRLEKESYFS